MRDGQAQRRNETGLADVLLAFAAHGGQLQGARRAPDNPLTLTHVQWEGPAHQVLEAVRRPEHEAALTPAEREAWVQLALRFPNDRAPRASGPAAPWMALDLSRDDARALSAAVARSRSHGSMPTPPPDAGPPHWPTYGPSPASGRRPPLPEGAGIGPPGMPAPRSGWRGFPTSVAGRDLSPAGLPTMPPAPGEVMAIPCVEIDLPPDDPAGQPAGYVREYVRDVARSFARCARGLPRVRELRGWMRGPRLVLGARMAVASGARPPTQLELDGACHALATALARDGLPFARIGLAEPVEWQAGAPLPES
jgi:hypothetical protein